MLNSPIQCMCFLICYMIRYSSCFLRLGSAGFLKRFVMHGISCRIKILVISLHNQLILPLSSSPPVQALRVQQSGSGGRRGALLPVWVPACLHQPKCTHMYKYICTHTHTITAYWTRRVPQNPLAPTGMTVLSQFIWFESKPGTIRLTSATDWLDSGCRDEEVRKLKTHECDSCHRGSRGWPMRKECSFKNVKAKTVLATDTEFLVYTQFALS